MSEPACHYCGKALIQAKTGRPPRYCSQACKSKAKRQRKRGLGALLRGGMRPETPRPEPVPAAAPPEPERPSTEVLQAQARRAERAAALGKLAAKLAAAEQALAEARAARALRQPDLEERHVFATYEGQEWLASRRGGFGPPLDTEAIAEAYRRRHEGEQGTR